jgi:hypothetical protein
MDVAEEVYPTHPGAQILLVTGLNEPAAHAGLPVAGLIQKPFSQADLLAKVREVVAGSQNP